MKALFLLPLLLLCACSPVMKDIAPKHFALKPSYEIDVEKGCNPVNKYRVEGCLDWNW